MTATADADPVDVDRDPNSARPLQSPRQDVWIPSIEGQRITLFLPSDQASVNFATVQYGTYFRPQHKVRPGTFWIERPNGGIRMIDVASYTAAGVTWRQWRREDGWERPVNDTKARKLAAVERKLAKGRRTHVKKEQMAVED